MYYLSLDKVWEIQDAALKMSAKQDDRGGRTPPPPSRFLSKRTFFLDGSIFGKSRLRLVLGTAFPSPFILCLFNI